MEREIKLRLTLNQLVELNEAINERQNNLQDKQDNGDTSESLAQKMDDLQDIRLQIRHIQSRMYRASMEATENGQDEDY